MDNQASEILTALKNELNTLLSTLYVFKAKVQHFHWNIEGPQFLELHEFLGGLYGTTAASVDVIAEYLRINDTKVQGRLSSFVESSKINEIAADQTDVSIGDLNAVLSDIEVLHRQFMNTYYVAESANKIGITSYIEQAIDKLEKDAWFLRSTLKGQ